MPHDFVKLGDFVSKEEALQRFKKKVEDNEVVDRFHEIIPGLQEYVVAVKMDKKTLHLKIENPAWRNELKFQETTIIEKINNFFNEQRVKTIRFFG